MLRNAALEDKWGQRNTVVVVSIAILVALVIVGLLAPPAQAFGTFTVNRTGDQPDADTTTPACDINTTISGNQCSLRAAIEQANANDNPLEVDRINFNISGTGVHTISPLTALPDITEPAIVNGYSQPGSSVNTLAKGTNAKLLIQLSGDNSNAAGFTGGVGVSASNTVVKGLVINGFNTSGIEIAPVGETEVVTNVRIEGNFLGTDPSGTVAKPTITGTDLFAASNSTVGGTTLASRNLISGNTLYGVFIYGSGGTSGNSENNLVQGNLIGTQKGGTKSLGNGEDGVGVFEEVSGSANGNRILSNSIFSNGGQGIDLGDNGPTANDPGDTDTGANHLQNFPVLTSATTTSGTTTIQGTLESRPGEFYTIQFFSSPRGDEGRKFIGQQRVFTDDTSGIASFTFTPANAVAAGQRVTATATRQATRDTSEFSAPITVGS